MNVDVGQFVPIVQAQNETLQSEIASSTFLGKFLELFPSQFPSLPGALPPFLFQNSSYSVVVLSGQVL